MEIKARSLLRRLGKENKTKSCFVINRYDVASPPPLYKLLKKDFLIILQLKC